MTLPPFLETGDRVALIAPSGPQPPEKLEAALQSVRDMGLEPVAYPTCVLQHGYLAGDDPARAADINAAFADESIAGVLCIRGGYGLHRLIGHIDFETIRLNPKPLYGYSDITALHIQLQQRCLLASWHTPMPGTEWHLGLDDYTLAALQSALFGPLPRAILPPPGQSYQTLAPGAAVGRLIGGNLSLVAATLGTPYEIDTTDKILFLEEVDEDPYCIDRMLTQLKHSGKLAEASGILLGAFTRCEPKDKLKKALTLEQIFAELMLDEGKPVLAGIACGHCETTTSLPMGTLLEMDTAARSIRVLGI